MVQGDSGPITRKALSLSPADGVQVPESEDTGDLGPNLQARVLVISTALQHLDGVKLEVVACMWRLIRVIVLISM